MSGMVAERERREREREIERERAERAERAREREREALDGWGPCRQSLLPPWPPATVGGALARGVGEQSSTPLPWRKKEREREQKRERDTHVSLHVP